MTAKAETQSISQEYDLLHPPAKVWRALTEPELLAAWLMANDMRPLVGHSFTFKDKPMPWWDGIVHCEVLEIDLHKRLRYSWRAGALDTVVTWTLTPTPAGGTRLVLEHSEEWAYAGMIFDLTGAAAAHAASGDDVRHILVPLVLAVLVIASWARLLDQTCRRPSRRPLVRIATSRPSGEPSSGRAGSSMLHFRVCRGTALLI